MSWWRVFRSWPGPARWSAYVAATLVLVMVIGCLGAVWLIRRPLPQTDGEIRLEGLAADVTVLRDDHGIPQIYADTTGDLFRAQGFVSAQERFYEMDVRRHITAGRLSELFGETTLETDKAIRVMGWRRVAEQELARLAPDTRVALEAYADGVNAYLDGRSTSRISVEYTALDVGGLDYTPEPWTPVDSLAWLKAMAWDLKGNMDTEVGRVLASVNHTPRQVDLLYPDYPYGRHPVIVDRGAVVDGVFEPGAEPGQTRNPTRPPYTADQVSALRSASRAVAAVPALLGDGAGGGAASGVGSNSWVVDGEHSATGRPILANDPHLGVSQPGIWLQMGLHCRSVSADCPYDVSGFTFSGVPGVVIGHNADIAWGFTNLYPDTTDLYLEKVRGDRWFYDGRWRPLTTRQETIEVAGGDDFELSVRETAHGPLLSDVSRELSSVGANAKAPGGPPRGNGYAVALQWTALQPSRTMDAVLLFDTASDWAGFRAAARRFDVPAQNLVYADTAGHIGYQAPGRIPIRRSGNDGSVPARGWLPEDDWTGRYVPFTALPNELDPERGYIVTANNPPVRADTYPYYLSDTFDSGYRAERIESLMAAELAGGGDVSVAEMAAMQLDDRSGLGPVLTPYLLDIDLGTGTVADGQDLLADWDFDQPADSAAAAYFNVVWRNLLSATFDDELRPTLRPDGGGRWWQVVSRLLRRPTDRFWDDTDTEEVETRDDILETAMRAARIELTRRISPDPADWTWGRLHRLDLHNQTLGESGIAPLEALLNDDGNMIGGGGSLVNATSWDARRGYEVSAAPSMRMVVSLADLDDSRWINLTGVSGHPWSGHYTDQTELYLDGETLPWAFSEDAVRDAADDELTLTP